MNCKICQSDTKFIFNAKVLKKYDVKYFKCSNCDYLFTEEPYWLEESYKSPINISDTGILDRNLYFGKVLTSLIYFFFNKNRTYLDFAGGYGIFTRHMRDIGFNFYWTDKYSTNLLARGFEDEQLAMQGIEAITVFEVFEHLAEPFEEIEKMLYISSNIFFSTTLLPSAIPEPDKWWYYNFNHGQHISFYSHKTLEIIARKYNLNFYSCGEIHLFTKKKINPLLFSIIVKLSKFGIAAIIKKFAVKSKTWEDHLYLKDKEH